MTGAGTDYRHRFGDLRDGARHPTREQGQTAATQRKLDELLRSWEPADSTLIAVEASGRDPGKLTRPHVAERERVRP